MLVVKQPRLIASEIMDTRGCLFVCLLCLVLVDYGAIGQGHGSLCRQNERFLSCGGCQKTCKDPYPDCKAVCRTGCYCNDDEVRNETGHCVKLADCPTMALSNLTTEPRNSDQDCPPDEEYRTCEPCNRTCDNPNPICPAQCARGCFCRDDLVRDKNRTCVKVENCTNAKKMETFNFIKPNAYHLTCGPHQVYSDCKACERTCSSETPICRPRCSAGCFCEDGYLKAPSGKCVRLEDCPRAEITVGGAHEPSIEDCSSDEIYLSCGWCEPSCWEPRPECPRGVCTRGCLCKPPLLRHHSGHCVAEQDCRPQKCSNPNEEFVCRYGCEARCNVQKCTSRPRRCVLGCHCKLGLLRDVTGQCVTQDKCQPSSALHPYEENITDPYTEFLYKSNASDIIKRHIVAAPRNPDIFSGKMLPILNPDVHSFIVLKTADVHSKMLPQNNHQIYSSIILPKTEADSYTDVMLSKTNTHAHTIDTVSKSISSSNIDVILPNRNRNAHVHTSTVWPRINSNIDTADVAKEGVSKDKPYTHLADEIQSKTNTVSSPTPFTPPDSKLNTAMTPNASEKTKPHQIRDDAVSRTVKLYKQLMNEPLNLFKEIYVPRTVKEIPTTRHDDGVFLKDRFKSMEVTNTKVNEQRGRDHVKSHMSNFLSVMKQIMPQIQPVNLMNFTVNYAV